MVKSKETVVLSRSDVIAILVAYLAEHKGAPNIDVEKEHLGEKTWVKILKDSPTYLVYNVPEFLPDIFVVKEEE